MDKSMEKYLGTILDDRYEIKEIIGTGGMAVVYKAFDQRLKRYVAVKILRDNLAEDAEFLTRFQAESRAVAMLSHPHIVSVYDVSHSKETEYIVMELLEGETLKQYLRRKGKLPWREAVNITSQIAAALSHAHSKGLVHRDVKPQNIMLLPNNNVKVTDFGIAYLQNEVNGLPEETIGSVHYISPEQASGSAVDKRSDIYSLGIVMYEMLSGVLPFDCEDEMKIPLMHLSVIPTDLKKFDDRIPDELIAITHKAMEPDLQKRYQSAEELLADLNSLKKQYKAEKKNQPSAVSANVKPFSRAGELTKEQYARRKRRSGIVGLYSGIIGVSAFLLFIGIFLWNYWLKDLFSEPTRIDIPQFVGENYDIINNSNYSLFNFTLVYDIDPDIPEGVIISQSPEAGKSYMVTDSGIDVELTVSTGVVMYAVPDYIQEDYITASTALEKMGFKVEKIYEFSDSVEEGKVISISPVPGEKLPAGSTVYLKVSKGTEVTTLIMPNVVGKDAASAQTQLESMGLEVMPLIYVESEEYAEGIVVSQTIDAGLEIDAGTIVYLTVSTGSSESEG